MVARIIKKGAAIMTEGEKSLLCCYQSTCLSPNTCLGILVEKIVIGAGNRLHHHLEVVNVVGESALLQDVAGLKEQLLEVDEQVVEFLG